MIAAALLAIAGPGDARADLTVVLAPISTLGEETRSKETRAVQDLLEKALGEVPGFTMVPGKQLDRAIGKAKRRDLRACDGDGKCLSELGDLVGARIVVYGELGGLGDAKVVYLKAVDVPSKKERRSTTLELGGETSAELTARGAAYQLLDPDRYKGQLVAKVDVKGATIFVDGVSVGTSPAKPVALSVGTHAVRVTHPEYRDYVRFVDIQFASETVVDAKLTQYPIVSRDIRSNRKPRDPNAPEIVYRGQEKLPWYREWYTAAGAGAVIFIGTAVVVGLLADGIDVDGERVVDPPR